MQGPLICVNYFFKEGSYHPRHTCNVSNIAVAADHLALNLDSLASPK